MANGKWSMADGKNLNTDYRLLITDY